MRRSWLVVLALGIVAIAVAMLLASPPADPVTAVATATESTPPTVVDRSPPSRAEPSIDERAPVTTPRRHVARAERERVHRRILDALQQREADAGRHAGQAAPQPTEQPVDQALGNSGVVDRTGTHANFAAAFEDLLPLIQECFDEAEPAPGVDLSGMLAARFAVVGDESVGGVVESVEFPDSNQVLDAGVLECVRESTMSTIFPAPVGGGRDELEMTLRMK